MNESSVVTRLVAAIAGDSGTNRCFADVLLKRLDAAVRQGGPEAPFEKAAQLGKWEVGSVRQVLRFGPGDCLAGLNDQEGVRDAVREIVFEPQAVPPLERRPFPHEYLVEACVRFARGTAVVWIENARHF